MAKVEDDIVY